MAVLLEGANVHADAEEALQDLIPACPSHPALGRLIAELGHLHALVGTHVPDDNVRARLRISTQAHQHARACRVSLSVLEGLELPEFATHADTIEKTIEDDLFNVHMATS